MLNITLLAFCTAGLMTLSNFKNGAFQREYELFTHHDWNSLVIASWIIGGLSGLIAYQGMIDSHNSSDAIYFLILNSVIGYATIQAIYTDIVLEKVDRWMLRIGYLIVLGLSIVYTITQFVALQQSYVITMTLLIYASLIFVFLFSAVGASDVRSLAILLPFLFVVNEMLGLFIFIVILILTSIVVFSWQHQAKEKIPVPILPYIFTPYLFIVPIFGYLMNWYQAFTLKY